MDFVSSHPILVAILVMLHGLLASFTVAFLVASLFSDLLGLLLQKPSLRATGWWTMFYAAAVAPLIAVTGSVRWLPAVSHHNQFTHIWLGIGLTAVLLPLVLWRYRAHRLEQAPGAAYLLLTAAVFAASLYQNDIGRVMGTAPGGLSSVDHCSSHEQDHGDPDDSCHAGADDGSDGSAGQAQPQHHESSEGQEAQE